VTTPRIENPRPAAAEPPKPEVPVVEAPKAPEPSNAPVPSLQTAPPQREAQVEARVRSLLQQASTSLNKIDYRRLGANAKAQYDTAKSWISLAEDQLKAKDLVMAENLADKAATLATQLAR
jgi:hypothetical protein